jgi:hypothetical protein
MIVVLTWSGLHRHIARYACGDQANRSCLAQDFFIHSFLLALDGFNPGKTSLSMNCWAVSAIMRCSSVKVLGREGFFGRFLNEKATSFDQGQRLFRHWTPQ